MCSASSDSAQGHGNIVAALAAGGNVGIASKAYVDVYNVTTPLRLLSSQPWEPEHVTYVPTSCDVCFGLEQIANHTERGRYVVVILCSWGIQRGLSSLLDECIDKVLEMGCVIVAAAGDIEVFQVCAV